MNRFPRFFACPIVFLGLVGCRPAPAPTTGPQPQRLPTTAMKLGDEQVTLQIANDEQEREIGLMYVPSMPADHGMIFVFPDEDDRGFWMKNTAIALDVLFVDAQGKIVSIGTMKPFNLVSTYSDGPAKYVIELNAGVAAKLKLAQGQQLAIPADAKDTNE